jgi:hypothetical protein
MHLMILRSMLFNGTICWLCIYTSRKIACNKSMVCIREEIFWNSFKEDLLKLLPSIELILDFAFIKFSMSLQIASFDVYRATSF